MISYMFTRADPSSPGGIQAGQGRRFINTPGPITVAIIKEVERQVGRDKNFSNVAALAVSEIPGGEQ
jgi:hypothetical protein